MFEKVPRPSAIAATMVAKLSRAGLNPPPRAPRLSRSVPWRRRSPPCGLAGGNRNVIALRRRRPAFAAGALAQPGPRVHDARPARVNHDGVAIHLHDRRKI